MSFFSKAQVLPGEYRYYTLFYKKLIEGVCTTASGNILASGNISLQLFMAPLETMKLLTFWYVVAEIMLRNYRRFLTLSSEYTLSIINLPLFL